MVSNSDFGGAVPRRAQASANGRHRDTDTTRTASGSLSESVAGFDCPVWWVARIERRLDGDDGPGRAGPFEPPGQPLGF
jgi:hypothetical protein